MQNILEQYKSVAEAEVKTWFEIGTVSDFPKTAVLYYKYRTKQIVVYNFARNDKWYACQNLCPHKMEMVLYLGMIGDKAWSY